MNINGPHPLAFSSGHGFSRVLSAPESMRVQPLRVGGSAGSFTSFASSASFASPSAGSQNPLSISPTDPPRVQKLKRAATEFEAMLLAKWWSAMKESGLGEQDDSTDPGHDTLDAMGIQAMSSAVASRGGLGIGAMLVRSLLSNAGEGAAEKTEAPILRPSNSAT